MRHSDVKNIRPPAQIAESDDPGAEIWLAGFETMRNAVLYLMSQEIKPTWTFGVYDANHVKQQIHVSSDSGAESSTNPVP